jgi:hypothetical protein
VVALVSGCELAEADKTQKPAPPKHAEKTPDRAKPETPKPKPGMSVATPRVLPNGRPANGNCTGRCPPPKESP